MYLLPVLIKNHV